MRKSLFGLLVAAVTLGAVGASAAPPASVVGNWSVIANQTAGVLVITIQTPAPDTCRRIAGTIYGNPIEGFYCPTTGRIHFVRKNAATNDTIQSYLGNVGDDAAIDRMAGTFVVTSQGGGVLREFNFQASRP
jgi:hypothetical protein